MKLITLVSLLFLATAASAQTESIRCKGKFIKRYSSTAEDVQKHCGKPDKKSEMKFREETTHFYVTPEGRELTPPHRLDTRKSIHYKQWWTYERSRTRPQRLILRFEGTLMKGGFQETLDDNKGQMPLRLLHLKAIEED